MGPLKFEFDEPYDWGSIIVDDPQTFEITYTITEECVCCPCPDPETAPEYEISNIILTLETNVEDFENTADPSYVADPEDIPIVLLNSPNVTITPTSEWISPDIIIFQNYQYPQYEGDTTNQVEATSIADVLDNYSNTLLYCLELGIEPSDKSGNTVTATVTYTLTKTVPVPGNPNAVPPIPDTEVVTTTQETDTQVYTFTASKNLEETQNSLNQLISIGSINQDNL